MTAYEIESASGAPPLALLGLEPLRAVLEYAGMRLMDVSAFPRGDGHTVVVLPGLASDKHATAPLTRFCGDLGYDAYDWGRGFNTGPRGEAGVWLDELAEHVSDIAPESSDDLSLIGWSLGGIYAREVAKRLRSNVRQVITIGTPFAGSGNDTHAGLAYRMLSGQKPGLDAELKSELRSTGPDQVDL